MNKVLKNTKNIWAVIFFVAIIFSVATVSQTQAAGTDNTQEESTQIEVIDIKDTERYSYVAFNEDYSKIVARGGLQIQKGDDLKEENLIYRNIYIINGDGKKSFKNGEKYKFEIYASGNESSGLLLGFEKTFDKNSSLWHEKDKKIKMIVMDSDFNYIDTIYTEKKIIDNKVSIDNLKLEVGKKYNFFVTGGFGKHIKLHFSQVFEGNKSWDEYDFSVDSNFVEDETKYQYSINQVKDDLEKMRNGTAGDVQIFEKSYKESVQWRQYASTLVPNKLDFAWNKYRMEDLYVVKDGELKGHIFGTSVYDWLDYSEKLIVDSEGGVWIDFKNDLNGEIKTSILVESENIRTGEGVGRNISRTFNFENGKVYISEINLKDGKYSFMTKDSNERFNYISYDLVNKGTIGTEVDVVRELNVKEGDIFEEVFHISSGLNMAIIGGEDKELFTREKTYFEGGYDWNEKAVLEFKNAPKYLEPKDKNKDNIYKVITWEYRLGGNVPVDIKTLWEIKILPKDSGPENPEPTGKNIEIEISGNGEKEITLDIYGTDYKWIKSTSKTLEIKNGKVQFPLELEDGDYIFEVSVNGTYSTYLEKTISGGEDPEKRTNLEVQNLRSENIAENSVTIKWDLNRKANGYVSYSEYGKNDWKNTAKENSFNYASHRQNISGLKSDTEYEYFVVFEDQNGIKNTKEIKTFKTKKGEEEPENPEPTGKNIEIEISGNGEKEITLDIYGTDYKWIKSTSKTLEIKNGKVQFPLELEDGDYIFEVSVNGTYSTYLEKTI